MPPLCATRRNRSAKTLPQTKPNKTGSRTQQLWRKTDVGVGSYFNRWFPMAINNSLWLRSQGTHSASLPVVN
jgi:hypothetical protein